MLKIILQGVLIGLMLLLLISWIQSVERKRAAEKIAEQAYNKANPSYPVFDKLIACNKFDMAYYHMRTRHGYAVYSPVVNKDGFVSCSQLKLKGKHD